MYTLFSLLANLKCTVNIKLWMNKNIQIIVRSGIHLFFATMLALRFDCSTAALATAHTVLSI